MTDQSAKPTRHHVWRIAKRTLSKSWDDSIFSESAQVGFWSALSLPPLLLGMLGSLAYVAPLFGPDTVRQRFFALGLYLVMLSFVTVAAPLLALGPRKIGEYVPESWQNVLRFGYYPMLFLGLLVAVTVLYRVSLPKPLPTHRLVGGAVFAASVFVVATGGLRIYLEYITRTGYTYGALATPIAFLLFAFFLGFAIMMGAELNAAIEDEWPAPEPHWQRWRARWRSRRNPISAPAAGDDTAGTPDRQPAGVSPS